MDVWAAIMLISGGLFAGGAVTFSWSRVPIWRAMPIAQFGEDFAATLRRTDKVQPALVIVAIASSVGYAITAGGSASLLAWAGAAGLAATLIASVAVLVPLQRRIITRASTHDPAVHEMRNRWFRGQLGRSVLSTMSFASLALAAVA